MIAQHDPTRRWTPSPQSVTPAPDVTAPDHPWQPQQPSLSDTAASEACELCGCVLGATNRQTVEVPDSGYLHPEHPSRDGRRTALACSTEHAHELVMAGTRSWVNEQLWMAKIRRVSTLWKRSESTLDEFAALAGLTPYQLRRALRWRMGLLAPTHQELERTRGSEPEECYGGTS